VARYDAAVHRLKPADREAIIGRIELQYSYEELAVVLDQPTPDAARVAFTRAMKHLAEEMRHA
jgi:DNA-directed RNA polymerase specialized sigma24 family protein